MIIVSQELNLPIESAKVEKISNNGWVFYCETDSDGIVNLDSLTSSEKRIRIVARGFISRELIVQDSIKLIRLLERSVIGYHDRLDALPGEELVLRAHITEKVRAVLFRHSFCLEEQKDYGILPVQYQLPDDNIDVVKSGFNWKESLRYKLPTDIIPGLFSMRLISVETKKVLHAVPLIVNTRPSEYGKKNKLLLLASNTTWQSYNIYGGRSRYRQNIGKKSIQFHSKSGLNLWAVRLIGLILPLFVKRFLVSSERFREPSLDWKFWKLSIRRPFTHCGLEDNSPEIKFMNHLAGAEWRLIAWLEREGIEYDFCSGAVLHSTPDLLSNYNAILLSSHCEYWTENMYKELRAQHNKGLWIINISGNTMYRLIDYYNDGSTRCVSLSFKDSLADETELTGGRFDSLDYGTAAPYTIKTPKHWVFDGTGLMKSDLIGVKSLNSNVQPHTSRYDPGRIGKKSGLIGEGASGWECDKRTYSSRKNYKLLAKGINNKGGSEMIIKEPKGNVGGTFSVGSILFGGALLIDEKAGEIVKNVLKKALK